MRIDFSGITGIPQPELVEGRTAPNPFSGKSFHQSPQLDG
jgi:hypothetical protein